MTFKARHGAVNLLIVALLLAALLVSVLGAAAGQPVATHESLNGRLIESSSGDSALETGSGIAIACSCSDPGGGNGSCC